MLAEGERKIWKFVLNEPLKKIEIPIDSKFLTVLLNEDGIFPALYFQVGEGELENRYIRVFYTGAVINLEDWMIYRGSVINESKIVMHVYEVTQEVFERNHGIATLL